MDEVSVMPTPLETGECEPVWIGTEEDKYAPIDEDEYYNTSFVMFAPGGKGQFSRRHHSIAFEKYNKAHRQWLNKYAEYNGYAKRLKDLQQQREEKERYYNFTLGQEGSKKATAFMKKIEGENYGKYKAGVYTYRYVIYPISLGSIVDIEAVKYNQETKQYTVYGKEEVVNNI